jgi:hypothetical protein
MLKKTLALLKDIKPGSFMEDSSIVFDKEELLLLTTALKRLLYSPFGAEIIYARKRCNGYTIELL